MIRSTLGISVILFIFLITSFRFNQPKFYGTWKATSAYLGEEVEAQKEGLNAGQLAIFKEIENIFIKGGYIELSRNHKFNMHIDAVGKLNGKWKKENNFLKLYTEQPSSDSLLIEIHPEKLVLHLLPERSLKITFTR